MTSNPSFAKQQPLRRHSLPPATSTPLIIRRHLYLSGLGALLGHSVPQGGVTTASVIAPQTFAAGRRKAAA